MSTTTHQGAEGAETMTAVERVCHEEQMVIWSSEMAERLAMGDWLREHLSYEDKLGFYADLSEGIREIVESAFDLATPAPRTDGGMTAGEVLWRCPECDCRSYARVDQKHPGGGYAPGPLIRCVNCKDVFHSPATPAQPEGAVPDSLRALLDQEPELTTFGINPEGGPDVWVEGTNRFCREDDALEYREWARSLKAAVRDFFASHPAGQSAGSGAETIQVWPLVEPAPDSTRTGQVEADHAQLISDLLDFHDALDGGVGNGAITIRCESETEQTRRNFRAVLREAAAALAARPAAPEAQGAERVRQALQQIVDEWDEEGVLSLKAYRAAEAALSASDQEGR